MRFAKFLASMFPRGMPGLLASHATIVWLRTQCLGFVLPPKGSEMPFSSHPSKSALRNLERSLCTESEEVSLRSATEGNRSCGEGTHLPRMVVSRAT